MRIVREISLAIQKFCSSQVILYHSCAHRASSQNHGILHNVTPTLFFEQVRWLKRHFDLVSLEQLFESDSGTSRLAAITFDDGYKSIFTNALPILEAEQIPCTVFLNGVTLDGSVFWRDKIRYLIETHQVQRFLDMNKAFANAGQLNRENFYRRTKSASINSAELDHLLDEYLASQSKSLEAFAGCISDPETLARSPLVQYGNHTYNHYVLSSLTDTQMRDQIQRNQILLKELKLNLSSVFCFPFGTLRDFDSRTLNILRELGYSRAVLSRMRFNFRPNPRTINGVHLRERYLAPANHEAIEDAFLKTLVYATLGR